MMTPDDLELVKLYAQSASETAFTTLVERHLNLVYSAALRQVRSPQLAEEVAQSVFTDLSQNARRLKPDTVLTAWLYQVTCRTAVDVIRRESRRQLREQVAVEMNAMNANATEWSHIASLLDEAMAALDETDRAAVLLRYFENKSLREVGATLGTSDDTAQKRVSRAVERLREFFTRRGVAIGASGLAAILSTSAVQAAPMGLTATISTAVALAGTAHAAVTTITATKALAMTTLQKSTLAAALLILTTAVIYEASQEATLRDELQTLRRQQASVQDQTRQFNAERTILARQLASLREDNDRLNRNTLELLKLRGEVTGLRQDSKELAQRKAAPTAKPDSAKSEFLALTTEEFKRSSTNAILSAVKTLTEKLALTPEQANAIRDIQFKSIDFQTQIALGGIAAALSTEQQNAVKATETTEEAEITALLTPEQRTAYEQFKAGRKRGNAQVYAKNEAARMQDYLALSPEQHSAVVSALANTGPGNAASPDAQNQLAKRLQALEPILTAEQLQTYRQRKQEEIERAAKTEKVIKGLLGK